MHTREWNQFFLFLCLCECEFVPLVPLLNGLLRPRFCNKSPLMVRWWNVFCPHTLSPEWVSIYEQSACYIIISIIAEARARARMTETTENVLVGAVFGIGRPMPSSRYLPSLNHKILDKKIDLIVICRRRFAHIRMCLCHNQRGFIFICILIPFFLLLFSFCWYVPICAALSAL